MSDLVVTYGYKGVLRLMAQDARERAGRGDGIEMTDDLLDLARKIDGFILGALKDSRLP